MLHLQLILGVREAAGVLQDLFVQIANGGDIKALATAADTKIEEILNKA